MIRDHITTYLADPSPSHMLLVAAPAGIGKTTLAVETAERFAAASGGQKVLYVAPRREFFSDVLAPMLTRPAWWYNWKARTLGPGQGVGQTCRYTPQMDAWLKRGYGALDFCQNPRICGWSYIHNDCPYHAQARRAEDIIVVQYEHLVLGHPRLAQAALIIGDELPLRAFLHPWHIPAADIVPGDMAAGDRETLMRGLRQLAALQAPGETVSGRAVLDALGGPEHVTAVCSQVQMADLIAPELRHADAAEQAPYGHLLVTLQALGREAVAAQHGDYIERVRISRDGLTLLLSRTPQQLPPHVIWLDATANAALYQQLFNRPVEVVAPAVQLAGRVRQVWSSLNTKTHLRTETDGTPKLDHIKKQVAQIRARGGYADHEIAFVSYKDLTGVFADASLTTHFHGARGTNRLEGCRCLIVIGTPQPGGDDLVTTATMVYHQRMQPFDTTWSTKDVAYAGQPWSYAVSGFWDDADLQTLLTQTREAELIQALHRARPLINAVDVWLLTNVPLPDIPVELVSLHELFCAPVGVDVYRWPAVLRVANERYDAVQRVTTQDFVTQLQASRETANKWLDGLIAQGWQEIDRQPSATRGPKVRAIVKTLRERNCQVPL